jgi:AraC-like DNA-binding protein
VNDRAGAILACHSQLAEAAKQAHVTPEYLRRVLRGKTPCSFFLACRLTRVITGSRLDDYLHRKEAGKTRSRS